MSNTLLQVAVFQSPSGPLVEDWSPRVRTLTFSTGAHGYQTCSGDLPMTTQEAFWWYGQSGLPHLEVSYGGMTAWEGRLEDLRVTAQGLSFTAFGYWRAYADVLYTALWSDTRYDKWRTVTLLDNVSGGAAMPDRFQFDTNTRLRIAPQKSAVYLSTTTQGRMRFDAPSGGSRQIVALTFTYTLVMPSGWEFDVYRYAADGTYLGGVFGLSSTGGTQTGTQTLTFSGCDTLVIALYATTNPTTYSLETGVDYLELTDVRVKTTAAATTTADAIAADLIAQVSAANPGQASASSMLVQPTGLDLQNELYEDQAPADILTRLASLGDSASAIWETGVYDDRVLYLRPRGSDGRAWYVDVLAPELERSIETLHNSLYATYQDTNGRTLRTGAATDAASIATWGLTRQAMIAAQTTSPTQATTERTTALNDQKNPPPRATIAFTELFDAGGARWPLWGVRSGDTITIRNLPPALSSGIDRVRTFVVSETTYTADTDVLSVVPETPQPELARMLAREAALRR